MSSPQSSEWSCDTSREESKESSLPDRRRAGRAMGSLLVLLLLVAGLGAWNYHRNWEIEKQTEGIRPYKSYAVEDLEALKSAYSSELAGARSEFEETRRRRVRPTRDGGSMAAHVDQFEATARTSAAIRNAAGELAERQGQISELERELELRTRFGEGLVRHVKRLTTI